MALSGSKVLAVGSYWELIVEWTATQNISANTSSVTAKLYWAAKPGVGYVSSSTSKSVSITIDGTQSGATATAGLSAGQKKLIHTYTKTVPHLADGSKTFAVSGTFDMQVTLSGTYYSSKTVSGSWALDSIARASSFTMTDKDIWAGEGATINISRASASFTHTVYYKFGGKTRTIATKTTAISVPFLTLLDDMNAIPNSTYGNGDMYVDTYSGTTLIGSVKMTFAIYVNSALPTINSFAVSENNAAINTLMGVGNYVQGHSRLQFSANASGKYNATISAYSITFNGFTSSLASWTYGTISKAGTLAAQLTVTDSRGFQSVTTINVVVIPYAAPTISSFLAKRRSGGSTIVDMSYVAVISALLVNSISKNIISAQLQYKLRTASTWTTIGTYTSTSLATTQSDISASLSYDFRVVVSDKLSIGIVAASSVSTASVLMDLAQFGIGVGKMWEQGALDVGGNAFFSAAVNVVGNLKAGSITATGNIQATTISTTNDANIGSAAVIGDATRITSSAGLTYVQTGYNLQDTNAELRICRWGSTTTSIKKLGIYADTVYISGEIENQGQILASLLNGFGNYSPSGGAFERASYWKDKNGVVHLGGLIKDGTNVGGTTLFNLPVGYRPVESGIFVAHTANSATAMRLNVNSSGAVQIGGTYTSWVSLAGISFKAA